MATKIKLQRIGSKGRAYFRVVVQEASVSPRGKIIEVLGKYQTLSPPTLFEVDKEKVLEWIKKGAKPTKKVRILLGKVGILPALDLSTLPKKKPKAESKPTSLETTVGKEVKKEEEKAEEVPKEVVS